VLKEYVRQSAESGGPQVLEWRCSPYYQNTGLHPLTEFFEALLEFVPAEPPSLRLDKLERYFSKARRRPAAGGHPAAGLAVVDSQRTPLPAAGA
jgi:hypothetical protein